MILATPVTPRSWLGSVGSGDEGFPRKTGADAWFDRAGSDRYEITEQSFFAPDEGVVTILRLHDAMIGF
jgi:hypothetical protein